MTREEAIRILDPETTAEALAKIEYYAGFNGYSAVKKAVDDACILAVAALREQEQRRWIPVDAVEVVRCRDCKFGMHFGDPEDEWINCMNLHGKPLMPFDAFCSYGERMDGYGNG